MVQENLFINYNGTIYPAAAPLFHLNRAMSYGDGLFETIRINNGELLFLEDHYDRMMRGLEALKLAVPDYFSLFFFHKQIIDLAAKENIGGNARIRITLFRSGKGLYEPDISELSYYIQVIPLQKGFEWIDEKYEVGIFSDVRKDFSSISFCKSINALPSVMAAIFKKEQQLDDCLLTNSFGKIVDAVSSNVFWIKNKVIYTPPGSDGGVEGVLRKNLLRLFDEYQVPNEEVSLFPETLSDADEMFFTNVVKGIKPVTKFGNKKFSIHQTLGVFQLLSDKLLK